MNIYLQHLSMGFSLKLDKINCSGYRTTFLLIYNTQGAGGELADELSIKAISNQKSSNIYMRGEQLVAFSEILACFLFSSLTHAGAAQKGYCER